MRLTTVDRIGYAYVAATIIWWLLPAARDAISTGRRLFTPPASEHTDGP
jgi:hypothetical protein